jgi:hypothetical protein
MVVLSCKSAACVPKFVSDAVFTHGTCAFSRTNRWRVSSILFGPGQILGLGLILQLGLSHQPDEEEHRQGGVK